MQLAVEEREMQNTAAGAEHERKFDELHSAVEQLTAVRLFWISRLHSFTTVFSDESKEKCLFSLVLLQEKLQLSLTFDGAKEQHQQEIDQLNERLNGNAEKHRNEVLTLIKEHEEIIFGTKKVSLIFVLYFFSWPFVTANFIKCWVCGALFCARMLSCSSTLLYCIHCSY